MLRQSSYTDQLTFFQKLRSFDFILLAFSPSIKISLIKGNSTTDIDKILLLSVISTFSKNIVGHHWGSGVKKWLWLEK